jgi:hypothetical protein
MDALITVSLLLSASDVTFPWTMRLEREAGCIALSHVEVPYRNMLISERVIWRKMEWLIRLFRI